jgi:hypothetical protein
MHAIKRAWAHRSGICFKVVYADPTLIPVPGRSEFSVEPHAPAGAYWFSQMHRDREAPLRSKWGHRVRETKGNGYSSCRQLRSSSRIQEQRRSFPQQEASTKVIPDVQYLGGRMTRHLSNPFSTPQQKTQATARHDPDARDQVWQPQCYPQRTHARTVVLVFSDCL